ncbi:hypothetical protein DV515_00009875, partial [Chloebia gouldiae]
MAEDGQVSVGEQTKESSSTKPWLRMTQQMHNLSLLQSKKHSVPSSPSAAKRLYRNLSEKLKGSHTSFDEAYFRSRCDRLSLRKASTVMARPRRAPAPSTTSPCARHPPHCSCTTSRVGAHLCGWSEGHARAEESYLVKNFQCNEAMFEAVEQQDLDAVQILLYQYTLEELDLNTPNIVTVESRSVHLSMLVQEAQQRVVELSAQAARAPEAPTNVCLMVTSSTSLTVTFQEPLSVNSAVVTKYKAAGYSFDCNVLFWAGAEAARRRSRASRGPGCAESRTATLPPGQEPCSTQAKLLQDVKPLHKTPFVLQSPHSSNTRSPPLFFPRPRWVEWSSSEDFSPLAGEIITDNLHSLRCSITGLRTGQRYYVRVSAYNMRGWGPPCKSTPEYASPSSRSVGELWMSWCRQERQKEQGVTSTGKTAVEESLGTGDTQRPWNSSFSRSEQLISTTTAEVGIKRCVVGHQLKPLWRLSFFLNNPEWIKRMSLKMFNTSLDGDPCFIQINSQILEKSSKLQNAGRKQSVSRSLKHLFHSSNKFVKTLKRGLYLSVILFYKDNLLVTNEDQIPIVEIDDSHSSSVMQDFLWFTKLSCMWDDIRWLRQNMAVSVSSSTALQARQKMLSAAAQLQNLLGTHNLGRVFYEPIKDRHGNMLIVTVREVESLYSFFNGKWMQVSKLQSQRKSLSTPEEPTALDILLITIQDILSYHKRSQQRLPPGLYLGYLKLCSSVDQIKVLVLQKLPNVLCHVKIRDNSNVSKDEWEWIQTLSGSESVESMDHTSDCPTQLFLYELQTAVKALLKQINLPLHQAKHFRLYTQEVLELGHNVSFLLLLPASDDVCTAPGQNNPYTPHSGFLNLPLQMFELGI